MHAVAVNLAVQMRVGRAVIILAEYIEGKILGLWNVDKSSQFLPQREWKNGITGYVEDE